MTGRLAVTHAISLVCPSTLTMSILKLSSPPSPSSSFFATSPSSSSSSSSSSEYFFPPLPLRSASYRSFASCSSTASKVRAEERLLMDHDSPKNLAAFVSSSRTFLNARTEQELLSGIRKEAEGGFLPSNVASAMEDVYHNYKNAVFRSGDPRADEIVLSNMTTFLDRIFMDVVDPFVFKSHHKAKREPFDYYLFGQNYIRPLIDFRNSYIGNVSLFYEMEEKLKQGHNIILMSNHQTEADPAVIALLIEKSFPYIAENLTYVAGDRVLTDPLCKPFSMGRNLICVYSKKHMNDVPELIETKRKANTRSLKEMAMLLRSGSQIIWIAPSGGRDRPDPLKGEWIPAPFDASSVDNMRRLVENSGVPGHMYPLALLCYDIMPPPPQVEKEIGEKRVISFHGVGLSVAPEISFSETAGACESPEMIM
ncbi:glycerol-3-phosphate acyltransferase, chloroplastic isoform X2 [Prosopis cineraria]|uniref:glycerol-3-phosphate acyltransferase, chloroplastic isoform X2 n=1 Tax=Prosopis cineraria TaxID=364024 RepID=UPI00240ED305|nr:glycerol-3-phosphate acyltransferase, chloroplastic isoform X2 [Prosopis cineraria]XP_054809661.1 glycerol-3-phosphate acyltransferase, chloroplastic isoform X2 [Prosopis cineraria]